MMKSGLLLIALMMSAGQALATPSWGAPSSSPANTSPAALKPGEWVWGGDSRAMGPMAVVVSITEQRAYVYRNGLLEAVSTVSTGKPGHETPTGVFTILQKDKDHKSNLYNSAPMPYMQRLTWDGIALHGGNLPGHPASHGCVRLPQAFAQKLFGETKRGDTVVVADAKSAPMTLAYPAVLAPVNSVGKTLLETTGAPDQ